MKTKTWILVADSGKARIYNTVKPRLFVKPNSKNLELVDEYVHTESRKKDSELVTDKQGHFGSGTFEEPTDPHRHVEDVFALELARILQHAQHEKKFHDLILIAPPTFMGMLNKHIPHTTAKLISTRIEKDYTYYDEQQLTTYLQEYL